MKKSFFAILILFLACSRVVASEDSGVSLDQVVNALEAPFRPGSGRNISNFSADFSQLSRLTSLDREQKGRGEVTVAFGEEGQLPRFRWDYREPEPQIIVSNGTTMWVYVPENRQVIRSDLSRDLKNAEQDPLLFLTGLGRLSRDFVIGKGAPFRDEEGNYILELRPRKPSPYIRSLQMVVRKEALEPRKSETPVFPLLSTTVIDPAGNTTTIGFRNVRVNQGIPEGRFTFVVPDGVDVVDSAEAMNF